MSDRFWSKVEKTESCWNWKAGKVKGYGRFWVDPERKQEYAHRISFELKWGHLDTDMCVLHKCDNPACVNPDHLFLGDRETNANDMAKKGRHWQQQKTHCPHGHPLSGKNVLFYNNGRHCRTCQLSNQRKHYHRSKRERDRGRNRNKAERSK